MAEVFTLSPEAIAPADIRRPLGDWLRRHGIDPHDVPADNRLTVGTRSVSIWTWYTDADGYVLEASGNRAARKVTIAVTEPFPWRVAQHLRDHASGRYAYPGSRT